MSRFAPVHLPSDRALEGKVSQTMLRAYAACPRSGYLYSLYKGDVQTAAMVRGSAFHAVAERATNAMIEQGEPQIPGDLVKAIVNEVLAEYPVPLVEHDFLRELAFRWAAEWTIDPSAVIACETLVVLELGGYEVRCKIDFAEARTGGLIVYVADHKTSRSAPAFEAIARKRPDGTLAGKSTQLILYALALAYGKPVRVEPCNDCGGSGTRAAVRDESPDGTPYFPCVPCKGRGDVEILEPFPLASQAEQFDLELVFPAIENNEGLMVRRPVTLGRLELGEYRESLIGLLERLADSEATGDWPAIISDEACSECPAKRECPIPLELRDHAGEINTLAEAAEAAEVLDRRSDENAALRSELKNWAKAHDTEIRYGRDKAWRFGFSESDRIEHKDAMWEAIQRAVDYGEPFDRSRFSRVVGSTTFKPVTLTPDELADEAREKEAAV